MNLNLIEDLDIKGHLTISKKFRNGEEEVVFDDHNIIVSGMGYNLAVLFSQTGSDDILDYQIDRFQVGVSGLAVNEVYQRSSLEGELDSFSSYGLNSNLIVVSANQIINAQADADNHYYCIIPEQNITRIDSNTVRYTLVVDEFAANDLLKDSNKIYLSEVGLFAKNPLGTETDASVLVAYRTFDDIYKTSDFSLIFRWSINF